MKFQADMSSKMKVAMFGDDLDARDPTWLLMNNKLAYKSSHSD